MQFLLIFTWVIILIWIQFDMYPILREKYYLGN